MRRFWLLFQTFVDEARLVFYLQLSECLRLFCRKSHLNVDEDAFEICASEGNQSDDQLLESDVDSCFLWSDCMLVNGVDTVLMRLMSAAFNLFDDLSMAFSSSLAAVKRQCKSSSLMTWKRGKNESFWASQIALFWPHSRIMFMVVAITGIFISADEIFTISTDVTRTVTLIVWIQRGDDFVDDFMKKFKARKVKHDNVWAKWN